MAEMEAILQKLQAAYGKPLEGYEEFLKTCQPLEPFIYPTSQPRYCKGYRLPSELKLHKVMMQPYYESRKMVARPTDVLVVSYPKTGTTWMQEICYLILNGANLQKANLKTLEERVPFIEVPPQGIKGIENLPDPRVLKTHLPYEELPQSFLQNKTKIVYITRNPKDTLVSFYFFLKMVHRYAFSGTLEEILDYFTADNVMYKTFPEHVLDFWKRRSDDNVLFLTYEGLHKDFRGGIRQIANFIETPVTDEQVDKIAAHCSFNNMSQNPMTNYSHTGPTIKLESCNYGFMRKGKVGDWKNHFTPEMNRKMDDYIARHLRGTGLEFEYEI